MTRLGGSFAYVLPLVLCLVWTGQALAQEPAFFSIRQHPGYPQPEKSLELLVRAKGASQRVNHFCVIGYREPSGYEYAWVHWPEGKALILWDAAADSSEPAQLKLSRRYLRLNRDVVASEDALKGSTYLVTKAWVKQVTRECETHGDKFVVSKRHKK